MNIYVPVGSENEIQTFMGRGFHSLPEEHRVIIRYEKGCEKAHRHDMSRQKAIHKNKLAVISHALTIEQEPFIMMDSDILYHYGISEMREYLDENPDIAAVALNPMDYENPHLSMAFVMIRNGLDLDGLGYIDKQCWCKTLVNCIRSKGLRVEYIKNGKVEHP